MDKEQFVSLSRETFGYFGFRSAVARELSVAPSTVCRWVSGEIPIPPDAEHKLRKAALERVGRITAKLLTA